MTYPITTRLRFLHEILPRIIHFILYPVFRSMFVYHLQAMLAAFASPCFPALLTLLCILPFIVRSSVFVFEPLVVSLAHRHHTVSSVVMLIKIHLIVNCL